MDEAPFNPAKRRLCPDGACIGVIGDDGRCRTCGRSAGGEAAAAAPAGAETPVIERDDDSDDPDQDFRLGDSDSHSDGDTGAEPATASAEGGGGGGFNPARRLCPDGACLGVLDTGGTCPVCGRAAS